MRPIVLVSNTPRAGAMNGRSDSTEITWSVAPSRAKQLPTATSALDAKKAVPCCRPAMMPVSIILSSRRAMVCIQASRCAFIAWVSEIRLTILPSAASEKTTQTPRKKARATTSATPSGRDAIIAGFRSRVGHAAISSGRA